MHFQLSTLALAFTLIPHASATSYYFDGSATSVGSGTEASPFESLSSISTLHLAPGDNILLNRGTTFEGPLTITSNGSATSPITVGAYGTVTASKPQVSGGGLSTVLLKGSSYITVQDLDITNPGDNTAAKRGVYVYGYDSGAIKSIILQNLYIHDVRGWMPSTTTTGYGTGKYANASGAIVIEAGGSTTPTYFQGITIQDNEIRSVDRQGIYGWSNWCQRPELAAFWYSLCFQPWYASTGLLVQRNRLYDIGGDGIVVTGNEGATVKDNVLVGFNKRSKSPNAGLWTANSVDALFQYNTVSGGTSTADAMSYDVDHSTSGTIFEYNVSHDNEGGFFLLCPYDKPTKNFTIRYNLSINDHTRIFQICDGALTNGQIYKNSIQIGDGISPAIVTENTNAVLDVLFHDNIVRKSGSGTATWSLADTSFSVDTNVFYGSIDTYFNATNSIASAPGFAAPSVRDPKGYLLLKGYPTINTAIDIAGDATVDFFGNSIADKNLGFYAGAGTNTPTWISNFDDSSTSDWTSNGTVAVVADPAGDLGNSVSLSSLAVLSRAISTTLPFRLNARIWIVAANAISPVTVRVAGSTTAIDITFLDATAYRTSEWQILEVELTNSGNTATLDGKALVFATTPSSTGILSISAGGSEVYVDDVFITEV